MAKRKAAVAPTNSPIAVVTMYVASKTEWADGHQVRFANDKQIRAATDMWSVKLSEAQAKQFIVGESYSVSFSAPG